MSTIYYVVRARALRLARRESQAELARRAGLHQSTISGIERGFPCSRDVMNRLGEALKCDPTKLMDRVFDPGAVEP
jgi:transcriptional regulator with XRE-family HTH domain